MPDFTPEDLASVGYTPEQHDFTPAELASVGYVAPRPNQSFLDKATGIVGGVAGEASELLGTGIKNVGTLVGSEGIKDYGQSRIDNAAYLKGVGNQYSPEYTKAGAIGADVLGTLALPAGSIPAMAASGAAIGLATQEEENPAQVMMNIAKSATISAALGKAIDIGAAIVGKGASVGSKALSNIVQGSKIVMTNTDDYANAAIDATLKKVGGDLAKSSPEETVNSILAVQKGLKNQATDLYTLRDVAAQKVGLVVDKSAVKDLAAKIGADITTGATAETKAALRETKNIIGTVDAPISFAKAEALSSQLSASISSAAAKGDNALARELGQVKDALQADISTAAKGNADVMELHNAATAFYRDSYAPIKNLDTRNAIMNKLSEREFIAKLANNLDKKPVETTGFAKLPDDVKNQILSSWMGIQRDVASKSGELDLNALSKAIEKTKIMNPSLFKMTNSFDDMNTLSKVLQAKGELKPKIRSLFNPAVIGFGGYGAVTGNIPALATAITIPVAAHLHAAGKLLNNASAISLLKTMRGLDKYPNSALAKMTGEKIEKLYSNQFKNLSKQAAMALGVNVSN